MILAILPKRGTDQWGSGELGAPRGNRKHNGIDYACAPDTIVCSLTDGHVTKLGYPYGDDLSYRYVEVTDFRGYQHRYFYVQPSVEVGERVERGDMVGKAQDIQERYDTNMKNHVHYEIKQDEVYLDPEVFHE